MASIPTHPWFSSFPSGTNNRSSSACHRHIIAVASAFHLGRHLQHRCADHLILSSLHSQEGYHSGNLPRINNIWCQGAYLLKKYSLLETIADALSASCSPCFTFFSGKKPEKEHVDKLRLTSKSSEGTTSNGRLWTNVFLALNVLVYVAQVATQGKLILWGAKVNDLIDKGQLWRLATSSFLHANIGHLMVNCFSLNSIGPTVEQLSGPRRFIAVYFTSMIASSLMSYRFCQSPSVGASGAIFGLVGSFAVFVLRHRDLFGGGKQDLQQLARVITLNMVIGLLSRGIDNWGHLGGLLGGAAMSWFLGPAWKSEFKWSNLGSVYVDRAPVFHFINRKKLR